MTARLDRRATGDGEGLRRLMRNAGIAALLVLLAFLALYPLAMLFYGSIHTTPPGIPGTFSLAGYTEVFSWENAVVLWTTIGLSFLHTVVGLLLALGLAWIVARTDTPYRRQLEVLITLPFFIPPILTAMAWGMLGNGKVGAINQLWRWVTGSKGTLIDMYSYGGVVWHMVQYATPFLFLLIIDALRAVDPSLEDAARMSGATRWQALRGVVLRLILPTLTASFLLSFMRGMENFESALFFGTPAGIHVITTTIYDSITQRAEPQYQFATALSFVVMALMALLLVLQARILRGRAFTTVTGKGYAQRLTPLGRWRWIAFAACALFVFVTLVLPVGQLLVGSFFRFYGFYTWKMLTLQHYTDVLANAELWRGIGNTLLLGFSGASLTMALSAIVAYVVVRTRWRVRFVVDGLAWLPWLMPGVVLAIGLLWAYAMLPGPIQLYGTLWALLTAYVTLSMPLSTRVMASAYAQLSVDLEESSRVHGAGFWQTLWRILVALAWPSFMVGWVLTFFGILRELAASVLLYSAGSEVLSVELLKLWINGRAAEVGIVGLMTVALVVLFRWGQLRFLARGVRPV